jgi:hypothetical protein
MSTVRDAFVSYASEDRHPFVAQLAAFLRDRGASIWYDDRELRAGEKLAQIDRGIGASKFGLAIISKHYPEKHWTMQELAGFRARESVGQLIIVPVLLGVNHGFIVERFPTLAGTKSIAVGGRSALEVGYDVLSIIRPDLAEYMHARAFFAQTLKAMPIKTVRVAELSKGPVRHPEFSLHVHSRLRFLQAALEDVFVSGIDEWIDNFSRDMHPHKELLLWEFLAALHFKIRTIAVPHLTPKEVFDGLSGLILFNDTAGVRSWGQRLPPDTEGQVADLVQQARQMYRVMFSDALFQEAADPSLDDR